MRGDPGRDPEAGITLVEMLVALALFGLVGLASFGLLDAVLRMRAGTDGRLESVAALDRALLLFGRDLAQSRPGTQALGEGGLRFDLDGTGPMSWGVVEGRLERRAGDSTEEPLVQILVEGLAGGGFRLLDAEGAWHEGWPPEGAGEDEAPVAAEMRLRLDTPGDGLGDEPATLRRLVALTRPAPEPEPEPEEPEPEEAPP